MTVANLFAKHRAGDISKEKFLYEVRKDAQLPFISNLTSYDDAIKILKQKSVIKEALQDEAFLGFGKKKDSYEGPNIDSLAKDVIIKAREKRGKTISHDKAVDLIKKYAGKIESLKGYSNKGYKPSDDTIAAAIIKQALGNGEILDEVENSEVKVGNTYEFTAAPGDTVTIDSISGDDMKVTTLQKGKKYNGEETKSWIEQAVRMGLLNLKESKSQKNILKEQENLHLIIDRMNPILVNKAVNVELAKLPEINAAVYQKTLEKVVKKLQKDPRCYDYIFVTNANEINKEDQKSKMVPVKKELKDPHHQMKYPKGLEKHKANTKATKTENRKGKPKGVKEMSSSAKGHKGVDQMKQPEKKHKVMEAIETFLKKKLTEDSHHVYGIGMGVETPDGPGTIKAIVGSTLTVELGEGKHKDYQMNIINHYSGHHDSVPNELDNAKIKKFDAKAKPGVKTMDEKKDDVIKKVMEFLKKKKKKKEIDELTTQDAQNFKTGKTPGTPNVKVGSSDEMVAKRAGITYTSYKS